VPALSIQGLYVVDWQLVMDWITNYPRELNERREFAGRADLLAKFRHKGNLSAAPQIVC